MDRKVREKIHSEMKRTGRQDKEYVVELIKSLDERPDVSKLIEQNYKAKADRIISSFKDENGIRDCFAIRNTENKTIYVDISKPEFLTMSEIEEIERKQTNQRKSKEEVIRKVRISKRVIKGQIQIKDYGKALKKELNKEVVWNAIVRLKSKWTSTSNMNEN